MVLFKDFKKGQPCPVCDKVNDMMEGVLSDFEPDADITGWPGLCGQCGSPLTVDADGKLCFPTLETMRSWYAGTEEPHLFDQLFFACAAIRQRLAMKRAAGMLQRYAAKAIGAETRSFLDDDLEGELSEEV